MTAAPAHSKPYLFFKQQICERLSVPMSRQDDGTRSYLVLAAVLQEWAEMGLLSAQMPSIAARAGLSSTTLERLFPSRDDLHLEALALGQQLVVEAMKKYPSHANPMLDLLELAQHYASILQEPYFKQFSLCQTILVRMDSHVREQASVIALAGNAEIKQFWHDRIALLIQDGLLRPASLNHMIFRLTAPIEAQTSHWYQTSHSSYAPDEEWLQEITNIVEGFFEIYGTAKYQAERPRLGRDLSGLTAALDIQTLCNGRAFDANVGPHRLPQPNQP
jgi:AcrR family transcriptional regulator